MKRLVLVLVLFGLVFASSRARADDPSFDRTTPRRAMTSFFLAAEANDFATAEKILDLRSQPASMRGVHGAELARELDYVLERNLVIDPAQLSDDAAGKPEDGARTERLGAIKADGVDVPITLVRDESSHDKGWVFSATTVARIPRLYQEHGPGWIEPRMPSWLRGRVGGLALWQWIGLVLAAIAAYAAGRSVTFVLNRGLKRITRRTSVTWDDSLVDALRRPSRFLFGVVAFWLLLGPLTLSAAAVAATTRLLGIISIGAIAWITIGLVELGSVLIEAHAIESASAPASTSSKDVTSFADLRAIRTQVRVLHRVVNVAIGIVAIALMLMQFEVVRHVGVSLLASAGVAGVVLGFAAQRTFSSLIAGIQLSFTQPIRIGDTVVIETQYGTIEEVTLTYVVVKIWDERRLIVPMTRFLEAPFENWTKTSAELHGTVFLYVDWRLPVTALRAEVDRIVEVHPLWDKRTKTVVVTNASERTLEVRVLVSATDADSLGKLRFEVRERLVAWLQAQNDGKYLPQVRVISEGSPET